MTRLLAPKALLLAAAAAAPLLLVPLGPGALWNVTSGMLAAVVYMMLCEHVARGREGLPPFRGDDGIVAWRRGSRAGLVLFAIGVLPFVTAVSIGAFGDASLARTDVLAAMLTTTLYLPSAIVAVIITGNPLAALWPMAWMRVIAAGPRAYVGLLVGYALTVALAWAAGGIEIALREVRGASVVAPFVAGTVSYLVWFAQAARVGAFVRTNARALAYDDDARA